MLRADVRAMLDGGEERLFLCNRVPHMPPTGSAPAADPQIVGGRSAPGFPVCRRFAVFGRPARPPKEREFMALFRRRAPEVIRRGVGDSATETRKERKVGSEKVRVRRVVEAPTSDRSKANGRAGNRHRNGGSKNDRRSQQRNRNRSQGADRRPSRRAGQLRDEEIIIPDESARKQMLVRVKPHQTQIVVLEGPVLVEHYVAKDDKTSLAGNMYVAKVKNVLPGMEAAFVDFGAEKNGVLYAGDISYDRGKHGRRRPRIEEALKVGDEILVQVVKDAMGSKGARLSNEVTVPGRHLVLVPDSDIQGISRRLPDDERARLRTIIEEAKPDGFGVIVRTAAAKASREEIVLDIDRLVDRWETIQASLGDGPAPRTVYEEPSLLLRVIREHFTNDFRRLMIDDDLANKKVSAYLKETAPDLLDKVQRYKDEDLALFERFHVEDQLRKALDRRVWLPSGGHLVIDRTEALTVIDVNTGKFVGKSNLEETVLANNLEAAEEIGRQLRLRDIGGIIVIDFIDMEIEKSRRAVLRRLNETLAKDKTRTQVFDVSNLGLVEMTRKNVSEGLVESFSDTCPTCNGRGVLLHADAAAVGTPIESQAHESSKD